ncbi:MAG: hypothetical protein ACJ8AT_32965 [Hyalangium sp.]|uniref:hypothetical protein n=1 Tax=Hyalangium sp. TaxID=2028555 RepID=UPI003899A06D
MIPLSRLSPSRSLLLFGALCANVPVSSAQASAPTPAVFYVASATLDLSHSRGDAGPPQVAATVPINAKCTTTEPEAAVPLWSCELGSVRNATGYAPRELMRSLPWTTQELEAQGQAELQAKRALVEAAPGGPEKTRRVLDSYQSQFTWLSRKCVLTSGAQGDCDVALMALAQVQEIRRAAQATPPKRQEGSCASTQKLHACLTARFGEGVLLSGLNSDFVFLSPAGTRRVRTLIGSARRAPGADVIQGYTLYSDQSADSSVTQALIEHVSTRDIDDLGNTTWRFNPQGSDRFFGNASKEAFESDTPVNPGARVLCKEAKKIEALGELIEVTLAGVGYHPEETKQHPNYRYRSPCEGPVIGPGVMGIRTGPYRPPRQPEGAEDKNISRECSETECRFSFRATGRAADVVFRMGESASAGASSVGDINNDGVDDYSVWYGDAGVHSNELYLSSAKGWTSVAHSGGMN